MMALLLVLIYLMMRFVKDNCFKVAETSKVISKKKYMIRVQQKIKCTCFKDAKTRSLINAIDFNNASDNTMFNII